jgi:hypothetical protein
MKEQPPATDELQLAIEERPSAVKFHERTIASYSRTTAGYSRTTTTSYARTTPYPSTIATVGDELDLTSEAQPLGTAQLLGTSTDRLICTKIIITPPPTQLHNKAFASGQSTCLAM